MMMMTPTTMMMMMMMMTIYVYCYYNGSTNVWMPRVKTKSFGWAENRNQQQYRLKFVVTITQQFAQKRKKKLGKNDMIKVS